MMGAGWRGGIRANTSAANALVNDLHIAEIDPVRLEEVSAETHAASATTDYWELLRVADLDAVFISATPEHTHYPMAKDSLEAGIHVLLEKPISLTLAKADELIDLACKSNLKFTIGYSQRPHDHRALPERGRHGSTTPPKGERFRSNRLGKQRPDRRISERHMPNRFSMFFPRMRSFSS